MIKRKPKIGFLGLMQGLYDAFMPELTGRQEKYAGEVIAKLRPGLDIHFPGASKTREDVEKQMSYFNCEGFDGIIIVNLVYAPGVNLVRALQNNRLPLLLANIQPVPEVTTDWDMNDLTYNQGIHGMQDTANTIIRTAGNNFYVVTDDWKDPGFAELVTDWATAAMTVSAMKNMKIAWFGKMNGMHDTIADWSAIMRVIGPEIQEVRMGELYRIMENLSQDEINAQLAEDRENFEIDGNMPAESHEFAAKLNLAIERMLVAGYYAGYTANFDVFGGDGRFKQLGLLAASNMMAKGYGYGAEGDVNSTILVAAGHVLDKDAHFTEMYAMDFKRDSMLMSHMGEGNWKIARKDKPVRLVYRELGIGGLEHPPTPVFMAEPGVATIASLVPLKGDCFRLVVMKGEVLEHKEYPNIEMPHYHFKPDSGVKQANTNWLKAGGTHHQCMHLGDLTRKWEMVASMLGIEYIKC
ncbi:MAG: L-fucose/L-arabinose isomerase family protein [Bacteroidota bacterium]